MTEEQYIDRFRQEIKERFCVSSSLELKGRITIYAKQNYKSGIQVKQAADILKEKLGLIERR